MDNNKILVGGVVGGIAAFLLGWLIYGMLLGKFLEANMVEGIMKAPEDGVMWAVVVASLFLGFLFAVIFGRWAGISTFKTGAIAGLVIGLLMSGHMAFILYGTANYYANMTGLIVDVLAFGVYSALVGGIVGWMLGRGKE